MHLSEFVEENGDAFAGDVGETAGEKLRLHEVVHVLADFKM